jgi:hypothetical protein
MEPTFKNPAHQRLFVEALQAGHTVAVHRLNGSFLYWLDGEGKVASKPLEPYKPPYKIYMDELACNAENC